MKQRGYYSGTNALQGEEFIKTFLSESTNMITELDEVVLILMKTEEIGIIVDVIINGSEKKRNPTITIEDKVAYWWIKAQGKIEIDLDFASGILGRSYSVYDFLVNVSSTMGRAYTKGNKFIITEELMGIEIPLTAEADHE